QDPAIRAGLLLLGTVLNQPLDQGPNRLELYNPRGDQFYLLWAMERVAVADGLSTIGNVDWDSWGSAYLLPRQRGDGGWLGRNGGSVDTCFALLFLRKANLSKDLTATLKGQVVDPGK